MSGSLSVEAFNRAARQPERKRKNPPPVSVRLSWAEYERLRRDAGALSMAAYIRRSLFGGDEIAPHRKAYTRKKISPSSELVMLGRMLGGLGQSGIAASLSDIAEAASIGALPVSPDVEAEISGACEAVRDMRGRLIAALEGES